MHFPHCPTYLSTAAGPSREGPEEKRRRLEASALQESMKNSISSHNEYVTRMSYNSLQELKDKVELIALKMNWEKVEREDSIMFMYIDLSVQPHD